MKTNHGEDGLPADSNLPMAIASQCAGNDQFSVKSRVLCEPERLDGLPTDVPTTTQIVMKPQAPELYQHFQSQSVKKSSEVLPNNLKIHELEERIDMLEDAIRRLVTANQRVSRALQF